MPGPTPHAEMGAAHRGDDMTTDKAMMTYGGEGAELGLMTLAAARRRYGAAKVDRATGTITADDRPAIIHYADGRIEACDTYAEALAALAECEVVGHDGDLTDGGDRTLAWLTEADSEDDDGARAYASIVREVTP